MRFDACPTINRATGPFVLAVSASKRQTILSLSPLLPLSQPHLPPVPLLASTVTTATTTKTTESHDRDDVAPKRSITALAEKSPFSDEKTFAAHSTAFKRSRRVEWYSQPILFMLYLLALLLEMSGRHCAVAGVETTFNLSSMSLDNSKSGVVEEQHPYNEYIWELNQLNPWLSACDLAGPAPADLQGSCGPPEVPKNCPAPCKKLHERMDNLSLFDDVMKSLKYIGNTTLAHRKTQQKKSSNGEETTIAPEQCLFYLEESHKQDVCREDFGQASSWSFMSPRENRYWLMSGLRLRHCCEHAAVNALAPGKGGPFEAVLNGGDGCVKAMEKLLLVDALAARLHCEFEEVLARYDCGQSYSVIHNCTHCKEAYRQWVCSSLVPYFAHEGPLDLEPSDKSWTGRRLRPCRSLCQSVEQRCPYLLPGDRAPAYPTQYAGEPTFLCRDPNIPETGKQATRALHPNSEDECCFKICSEEKPALGICANCLGHIPKIGFKYRDPSVAPQCEIITSLSGQQQAQPTLQQLSLCGSGGIGSMIDNENSVFVDSSVSSLLSDLSSKTSLPITTNSVSASSSSTSIVKSSSVPLLCFFSLCNLFFCSQYATNHLLGITNIMKYFESLCTSFIEIFKLFLIELLSILNYFLQDCSFNYLNNIHGHFHLMIQLNASFNFLTALISMTKNGIVIAERYVYQGYRCYYYYCYRWWLWPRRWKNFILHRYSLYRFCSIKEYCCLWCYWCWLWPHRWKKKEFRIILNKDRIYLSLKSRKKRRRKMRFNAFCRKFDLVRSTSCCRESP
ncbi:PREDICTED: uncharacterized protein LOC105361485 [Ceratosolen solmsi marchali]|uniref:Uncharacterized protein LOC105361485 n=1 Tax=Ceratosolen solmsi marchali TaxID=326594 RepID=A0AAJ7DUL2_9HYME|nr:PREDICTED: uncharacterized protein LOC105361485 [Ceratosolen solmsi marchali]XP_011496982.1 PREDICTED: uncharacterized protein LOC105361485 [Ceratosolen solmsi marchali]XP_011496983.1 PREDICTED: uncharacterized protein LOC105361485 [Ceratosolen solmsi marchali]